jgi:type IV pilus assembly protein PilQ
MKKWFMFLCGMLSFTVHADMLSVDIENVSVKNAILILAKSVPRNVMVSASVYGTTSLHLKNLRALDALQSLLQSRQLMQWKMGDVWFIGQYQEFVKYAEDQAKLKVIRDETVTLQTHIWQLHYAKADAILSLIQDSKNSLLSKRGMVRADIRTNILYVRDTRDHLLDIAYMIQRLDVPVQQVLIEVYLASIDCDYERELGLQFSLQNGFSIAKLKNSHFLNVELGALEKAGHGEIISNPILFTANREAASIESGEEIPYQEVSRSGASGVVFKKAVLSLKITPQIMPDKQVLLEIQVNQDKPNKRVVLGVPSITTRQMHTHVRLKNGQTIVLGGIYESNNEEDKQGIPFLGKIPLVGWLFHQQNVLHTKRELLIFVTPKIIIE